MNWLSSGWRKASVIHNHQQLKIRNMKRTSKFLALFSCVLLLASCKDDPEKQLERMQGEWVHVKGRPAFTLSGKGGTYNVTRKANIRGKVLETSYLITEHGGKLFIEKGFAILLTYDKERDRIILSPGGEYKRVSNIKKGTR